MPTFLHSMFHPNYPALADRETEDPALAFGGIAEECRRNACFLRMRFFVCV